MSTIKDVAAKAGVTATTVSRVLNNRGYISNETRKKVYWAMSELNYRPNEMARFLSKQQTNYLGIILPSVEHPYFGKILHWFEHYATLQGYKVMVCISADSREKELEYIDMLHSNRVMGIVLCSRSGKLLDNFDASCPVITFERELCESIPSILCDNFQGGMQATQCLIDAGCKHVAIFAGAPELELPANLRVEAFTRTCAERGVVGEVIYTDEEAFRSNDYESYILKTLQENPNLDGVFATSDVMAAQIIRVCHKLGKYIPEDICVIGFDDVYPSMITYPAITTIHQPVEEMCRYAVEMIVKKVNKEMVPSKVVLPVSLVRRESVRPAKNDWKYT